MLNSRFSSSSSYFIAFWDDRGVHVSAMHASREPMMKKKRETEKASQVQCSVMRSVYSQ